jgi:hypothetical protein
LPLRRPAHRPDIAACCAALGVWETDAPAWFERFSVPIISETWHQLAVKNPRQQFSKWLKAFP